MNCAKPLCSCLLLLLFVASGTVVQAQTSSPSCEALQTGLFYYYSADNFDYAFMREADVQKEINLSNGDTTLWTIKWKNDCTYTLKYVSGGPYTEPTKLQLSKAVIVVTILEKSPDYYIYNTYLNRISDKIVSTDTLWLKEKPVNQRAAKIVSESYFQGGDSAWQLYLTQALQKDEKLLGRVGKKSTVYVQFLIDADGTVTNVKAMNLTGTPLAKKAVDVIKASPKWVPLTIDGKPLKAYRVQPVLFNN